MFEDVEHKSEAQKKNAIRACCCVISGACAEEEFVRSELESCKLADGLIRSRCPVAVAVWHLAASSCTAYANDRVPTQI